MKNLSKNLFLALIILLNVQLSFGAERPIELRESKLKEILGTEDVKILELKRDLLQEFPGILYPHIWFDDYVDYNLKVSVNGNIFCCSSRLNIKTEMLHVVYCAPETKGTKLEIDEAI